MPVDGYQRCRANLPLMLDLITYLTEECCAGHPDQCAVPGKVKAAVSRRSSTGTSG